MTQSTKLYWQKQGNGPDLVLIHGWGMNSAVWSNCIEQIAEHYTVHCVDLPGYGFSHQVSCTSMDELIELVLAGAPEQAIWLGWSLGGLIATRIATTYPDRVIQLVTLASSPKFAEMDNWRGIKPQVLSKFTQQLSTNFSATVDRFISLQAMGSPTAKQDIKLIKQAILSRPTPSSQALSLGLTWLEQMDIRESLSHLSMPVHRWYGRLDGLVPVSIATQLDQITTGHHTCIFAKSSHAPFITETEIFISKLKELPCFYDENSLACH